MTSFIALAGSKAPGAGDRDPTLVGDFVLVGWVKWFDPIKGIGFVEQREGEDILINHRYLRAHDRKELPNAATLVCEASMSPRALRARRILSIDLSTAIEQHPGASAAPDTVRVDRQALLALASPPELVVVSWFIGVKGYGFARRTTAAGDIFIHLETVRRAGVNTPSAGKRLIARIAVGPKGPVVVEVVGSEESCRAE